MTMRSAFFLFWITLSAATVWAQDGPNRPEPRPVALDTRSTAVLVLDLNARCDDPKQVCSKLTGPVGDFLDKPLKQGGLALNRYSASLVLVVLIVVLILIVPQRPASKAH